MPLRPIPQWLTRYRSVTTLLTLIPCLATPVESTGTSVGAVPDAIIARGAYLAAAGNCISCHTRPGGAPYSGGVAFQTPFGTIYSTNITPEATTGIGRWTAADLRRAMQEGYAADGSKLFPAFPYTSFTKVTDGDVTAIFAFLRTVPQVHYSPPRNSFIMNLRWPLKLWDKMFFTPGRFAPDATKSTQWNRGGYLVEGLGHCNACHSPRNSAMAELPGKAYEGGAIQEMVTEGRNRRWSAVNLTSAKTGLAAWSVEDLTKYLHNGYSLRGGTFGPMNEVITNSLSKLDVEDVRAMATYIKSLPALEEPSDPVPFERVKAGSGIYKDRCENCHSASGRGGMFSAPPLVGSAVVQATDPASLINVILYGPHFPSNFSSNSWETMQPYATAISDEQIAAVSNYIRNSWGNHAPQVTASDVAAQR